MPGGACVAAVRVCLPTVMPDKGRLKLGMRLGGGRLGPGKALALEPKSEAA